jgi:glycosyltransferase involved in cell wall biosynthesis
MKLAYITTYDSANTRSWSGIGYHMGRVVQRLADEVQYVGPLRDQHALATKARGAAYRLVRQKYLRDRHRGTLESYARQAARLAAPDVDVLFSPGTIPIAYMESARPIVFWTDATIHGMVDFYPDVTGLCPESLADGHAMEQAALDRCALAIYSSAWAARSAVERYGVPPAKVRVLSFGANLARVPTHVEMEALIAARSRHTCHLLFLGVDWERKGGALALEVVERLNAAGLPAHLTVAGCEPVVDGPLPAFVTSLGFLDKSRPEQARRLERELGRSHFMILPTLADCTPIIFGEANAYGVPCLAPAIGGIPSVITDHVNGMTFAPEDGAAAYAAFVFDNFASPAYAELARSSFNEYLTRLNWNASGRALGKLLAEL